MVKSKVFHSYFVSMTGLEIKKTFLNKIDKSYSKFVDDVKLNRIFKMALSNLSEKKYMGLTSQKEYDDLRYQVTTEKKVPINGSRMSIAPLIVTNVVNNGLIVTVTTHGDHNLFAGQQVTGSGIAGIASIPDINGTFTVFNVPSSNTFTFLVTFFNGTYTLGTGQLVHDRMLADYIHLFTIKCKSLEAIRNLQVSQVLNRTPCIVVFNKHNNLATGEKIIIADHPDNAINGTFYYEALTDKKGRLWMDKNLSVPVQAPDSQNQGGSVSREYYNYAQPLYSDRKISVFEKSTADSPSVATADAYLKFYPEVSEVVIDYFSSSIATVDVTNDIFNLNLVYPEKLQYLLIDEAILIYTSPSRDVLLNNLTEKGIVQ